MLRKDQFELLNNLYKKNVINLNSNQVQNTLKELEDLKLIINNKLTDKAYEALKPYKVENAIIMAAGMSSRFAPLSYEMPKGLLNVKGEILIERQIKQLQEVGINDITIVVGYMQEKMYYLEKKFNVKIVVNSEYYRYNNPSSLMLVLNKLSNTFICSSDNYFSENPFETYVYESYYASIYEPNKTDEYCIQTDENGRINHVVIGGEASWIMIGHVYFNRNFSKQFIEILQKEYTYSHTKEQLWENLYMRYINTLSLYIKKYDNNIIYEFDSLDDLRQFDDTYIENSNSDIIKNICNILKVKEKDIKDIKPLKGGLTNDSFSFTCFDKKYVYRHPGKGSEQFINRKNEVITTNIAKKLGIDPTLIYIDKTGWKISLFIEDARTLDYHNKSDVKKALNLLKKLHTQNETVPFEFNVFEKINDFEIILEKSNKLNFNGIEKLKANLKLLREYLSQDEIKKCLCHVDAYDPNFLIDKNNEMCLIDWEYAGMGDPASDVATFIACSPYTIEQALEVIEIYLGYNPCLEEKRHFVGFIAVLSYYWFLWALNQESNGVIIGEYTHTWFTYANEYSELALNLYKNGE